MSSTTGKEDQKTLCNLMKMLEKKKAEAVSSRNKRVASRVKKTVVISPQSESIKKGRAKRKIVTSTQNNKISRWLRSPIDCQETTTSPPAKKKSQRSKPSSSKACNESNENADSKESTCGKKSSNKTKKSKGVNKDYSYDEKYGVLLPSFEKILRDRKNFAEHKQQARELKELIDGENFKIDFYVEQDEAEQLRDCRHMTHSDIVQGFDRYGDFLEKIINGDEFSLRHEKFHDVKLQQTLMGSSSMLVFTDEQINQMVGLLRERFDPDDQKTRYFFQVLIPELTLRLFMDDHKMSQEEATEYLNNMNIPL